MIILKKITTSSSSTATNNNIIMIITHQHLLHSKIHKCHYNNKIIYSYK